MYKLFLEDVEAGEFKRCGYSFSMNHEDNVEGEEGQVAIVLEGGYVKDDIIRLALSKASTPLRFKLDHPILASITSIKIDGLNLGALGDGYIQCIRLEGVGKCIYKAET